MDSHLDVKDADEKIVAHEVKTEADRLPFVEEENKHSFKIEDGKDVLEVEDSGCKVKVETSDEAKVKKREESSKVEGPLNVERRTKSLKTEENKDSLKVEESKVALRDALECAKSENTPGFCVELRATDEEKSCKVIKAEELMDVDGLNIDQVNIESLLANLVEDRNEEHDIPRTPPLDNGTDVGAIFHDSQRSSAPPADLDAGEDVQMTIPDAEVERAATVAPQQIIIKDEPMDMDIDSLLIPTETETSRPEKRRRVFMDAVVMPFDRSARAHADTDRQVRGDVNRQALYDKFELLKNPKVKKPKNTPVLSLDTVMARLQADKIDLEPYPIDLEPEIRDVTVRRDFMSKEYGGNSQETYPKIKDKFWKKTGMRYFMYLNLNFNPRCPEIPGAPGLLFDAGLPEDSDSDLSESGDEDEVKTVEDSKQKVMKDKANDLDTDDEDKKITDDEDRTEILFARLGQSMWQYQGQYVLNPVNALTVDEWKQQPNNVRRTWSQQLSIKRWGRDIRAEISLRRELGRKPTKAERKNALKDTENKFLTVTPEEISTAFDRKEVVIVVSTMKCVGYNSDFQRALAEKMPLFVPPPRKAKKASPKSRPKPSMKPSPIKREVPSPSRTKKRRRQELESYDDFEDDSDVVHESEDEDKSPREIYRPRGTRSRPIVLP